MKQLTFNDFENAFNEKLSNYVKERINQYSFQFLEFNDKEQEELIITIVKTLLNSELTKSGEHRREQWEAGWDENFQHSLKNNNIKDQLIPKYFQKYNAIRWQGKFIKPISDKFELNTLSIILDWLFDKYLRNFDAIYEFGCGTGHNLLRARDVNQSATLFGLDWAHSSQKIITKLRMDGIEKNIYGYNFDYFNPDYNINLNQNSVIYTVASLEQVGDRWAPFLEYILNKRPKLCIHVEPIAELLDEKKLIDYLSIEYFKKRNYLNGFLKGIKKIEESGKIKIHSAKRTNIGSLFIEGYSVIVWSPI